MGSDTERLTYWRGHHTGWQSSGLSQKAYCQREGIAHSSFERWGKRIRSAINRTPAAPSPVATTTPLTLIPVRVASPAPHGELVLRGASGWQLTLPATVEINGLADLIGHLQ